MFIHSLGLAVPGRSFAQAEVLQALEVDPTFATLTEKSRNLLRKVLSGKNGIERRHLALDEVREAFDFRPDAMMARFRKHAPDLAAQAAQKALAKARLAPDQLDALFVATCTGYLCPGLSSYVSELAGLRSDAWLQDLVGLGCGAAIPALRSADALLAAHPSATVACLAVEVCSAAFYLDNDPGVIISACLFGDGAAATIWKAQPGAQPLRCHAFDTHHDPKERDRIRFEQRQGKLRNLLHPSVPSLAAGAVRKLYDRAVATDTRPIARILSHAGGRDVLDELEKSFPEYDFDPSRRVLRRHGNMSSPSVLFALAEALKEDTPETSGDWWLTSFGAGFSAHACRLGVA